MQERGGVTVLLERGAVPSTQDGIGGRICPLKVSILRANTFSGQQGGIRRMGRTMMQKGACGCERQGVLAGAAGRKKRRGSYRAAYLK